MTLSYHLTLVASRTLTLLELVTYLLATKPVVPHLLHLFAGSIVIIHFAYPAFGLLYCTVTLLQHTISQISIQRASIQQSV